MIPQRVEVVGHAEERPEAAVDREVGRLQHHRHGGHRPHDGLHRLERCSRPLFGLSHERRGRLLGPEPRAPVAGPVSEASVAGAVLAIAAPVRLVTPAVGGVAGHGVGGGGGGVRRVWAVRARSSGVGGLRRSGRDGGSPTGSLGLVQGLFWSTARGQASPSALPGF